MSMDEQFWYMKQFCEELDDFNQQFQESWKEVEVKYESLSTVWQDEFRDQHDQIYLPLQDQVKQYLTQVGLTYIETLSKKLQILERYLRGG